MACQLEYYTDQDFEAIISAIDEDIWDKDADMNSEIDDLVLGIVEKPLEGGYRCETCQKVCKSKQGLSRHRNSKHTDNQPISSNEISAESRLDVAQFMSYINNCAKQLATDGCYSDETLATFSSYKCSLDEASYTYQFVKHVIKDFDGDGEKFFPKFYDIVSSNISLFKNLNKKCSVILGDELANTVLAHLRGTILPECEIAKADQISEKERNIIKYISGYVMKTLYCRLRKSSAHRNDSNVEHMSILLAGKDTSESSTTDDRFINAKNRGGLWKVTNGVFEIFFAVERYFRDNVAKEKRKIDVKIMVSALVVDFSILSHFSALKNSASQELEEESSLNLLESMLTLYLRARTFKYVSLRKEKFKLDASKKKMKSLRTSIKQATSKLELGH